MINTKVSTLLTQELNRLKDQKNQTVAQFDAEIKKIEDTLNVYNSNSPSSITTSSKKTKAPVPNLTTKRRSSVDLVYEYFTKNKSKEITRSELLINLNMSGTNLDASLHSLVKSKSITRIKNGTYITR